MTVANFGPLTCSIITTTRKFFTILGSVLLFGNSLIARQWFGVICVFAGLTLDSIYGKAKKKMQRKLVIRLKIAYFNFHYIKIVLNVKKSR